LDREFRIAAHAQRRRDTRHEIASSKAASAGKRPRPTLICCVSPDSRMGWCCWWPKEAGVDNGARRGERRV